MLELKGFVRRLEKQGEKIIAQIAIAGDFHSLINNIEADVTNIEDKRFRELGTAVDIIVEVRK